jgi:hypothetical protein
MISKAGNRSQNWRILSRFLLVLIPEIESDGRFDWR